MSRAVAQAFNRGLEQRQSKRRGLSSLLYPWRETPEPHIPVQQALMGMKFAQTLPRPLDDWPGTVRLWGQPRIAARNIVLRDGGARRALMQKQHDLVGVAGSQVEHAGDGYADRDLLTVGSYNIHQYFGNDFG